MKSIRQKFSDLILQRSKRNWILALGTLVLLAAAGIYALWLNNRIERERDRLADTTKVVVLEAVLRPPPADGIKFYLNGADVRAVARTESDVYLATGGGLIATDESGGLKRWYTTLDGLPDNDLTSLATFRGRLFIGTASAGLVAFDGKDFTQYQFLKPRAAHISVLCSTDSELLIGTLGAGLLQYDGERFSARIGSATGADFTRVTSLLPVESRLYIGTQDRGLYIWKEAQIERIDSAAGLPSPRVTGLALLPERGSASGLIAVATDFGVVTVDGSNNVSALSDRPNVTSLAVFDGGLWAGLFGGGVVNLFDESRASIPATNISSRTEGRAFPPEVLGTITGLPSAPSQVLALEENLWVISTEGAFIKGRDAAGPAVDPFARHIISDQAITGGHITTLSLDGAGRLWIGYFDRGVDVLDVETADRIAHVEDERVSEVNFLTYDTREGRMLVGTSRGLVVPGRLQSPPGAGQILTRAGNGLANDAIAHLSISESPDDSGARRLVLATAGGLTELSGGRTRSVTAFHGLPSNHLYTTAFVGAQLFAGSLAGLVELDGLRVVRTYKTSNSQLSHDWVTALVSAGGVLYIGTNGGGVDALLPSGEWTSFADEIGRFEVNQNSMHYDGSRLYVGTSDRGLLVFDTRGRRWRKFDSGLTSKNVTAITGDDRFIFVGTLNGLTRIEKRVLE